MGSLEQIKTMVTHAHGGGLETVAWWTGDAIVFFFFTPGREGPGRVARSSMGCLGWAGGEQGTTDGQSACAGRRNGTDTQYR